MALASGICVPAGRVCVSAEISAGHGWERYHIGEDGYYDTPELLSAVEWLDQARSSLSGYEVLLVLINAQPGGDKSASSWPWQAQLVGSIETLVHVRTSWQRVREIIELKMAVDHLEGTSSDSERRDQPPVVVAEKPFLFGSATDRDPPLSWHLTPAKKQDVGAARMVNNKEDSWRDVRRKLGFSVDPKNLDHAIDGRDD